MIKNSNYLRTRLSDTYRGGSDDVPLSYNLIITGDINNIQITNTRNQRVEYLPRFLLDTIRSNYGDRINRMVVSVSNNRLRIGTMFGQTDLGRIDPDQLREIVPVVSVFPTRQQAISSYVNTRTAGGGFFDFLFSKKVQPTSELESYPKPELKIKPNPLLQSGPERLHKEPIPIQTKPVPPQFNPQIREKQPPLGLTQPSSVIPITGAGKSKKHKKSNKSKKHKKSNKSKKQSKKNK